MKNSSFFGEIGTKSTTKTQIWHQIDPKITKIDPKAPRGGMNFKTDFFCILMVKTPFWGRKSQTDLYGPIFNQICLFFHGFVAKSHWHSPMWFLKRLDRYLRLLWDAIDAIFQTFSKKMRLNLSFWVEFGDFGVDLVPNLCFGAIWYQFLPFTNIHTLEFSKICGISQFLHALSIPHTRFSQKNFAAPNSTKKKKNEIQIPPQASSQELQT